MSASIATGVALATLGYYPTLRIAGADAVSAMPAGIGISLLAACAGAVPISLSVAGDPRKAPQAILTATAVRFLVVLAVTASVVLSNWFDRATLALWVGISYLAMLAVDTIYAIHIVGKMRDQHS
jgi:hypothetical protein